MWSSLSQFHKGEYDDSSSDGEEGVLRSAISGKVIKRKVRLRRTTATFAPVEITSVWLVCPCLDNDQIKKTEIDKAEAEKRRQLLKFYNSTRD